MQKYGFDCPIFLTSFHFFLTFLFLEILVRTKFIQRGENISTFDKWLVGGLGIAAVIFQNLNLLYNSVGFYQLSKLCCIPFMVLYKFFIEKQKTPFKILFSLIFLLIGLALFTINDLSVNLIGSIIALIAIPTVSLTQIFTKTKQDLYSVNGPTLQYATSFPQFFLSLISALILETHGNTNIFDFYFTKSIIILILITGFLAIGTNACAFGLIGKTSAITFQVVGHVKTILIFIFVLIMFKNSKETLSQTIKKIIGLAIAMIGVILYTIFEIQEKENEKKQDNKPILIADNADEVREINDLNNELNNENSNEEN